MKKKVFSSEGKFSRPRGWNGWVDHDLFFDKSESLCIKILYTRLLFFLIQLLTATFVCSGTLPHTLHYGDQIPATQF